MFLKLINYLLTGGYAANTTCIHFGYNNELSIGDAGSILTAMEFLQIAVFFVAVIYLQKQVFSVRAKSNNLVTAISDYSITVRNIPPDTTEAQLIKHFNDLYQLGEWCLWQYCCSFFNSLL